MSGNVSIKNTESFNTKRRKYSFSSMYNNSSRESQLNLKRGRDRRLSTDILINIRSWGRKSGDMGKDENCHNY